MKRLNRTVNYEIEHPKMETVIGHPEQSLRLRSMNQIVVGPPANFATTANSRTMWRTCVG